MPRIKLKWIAFVKINGKRPEAEIFRPHKMPVLCADPSFRLNKFVHFVNAVLVVDHLDFPVTVP